MNINYVPPEFGRIAFNCPFCNAYSHMLWHPLLYRSSGNDYSQTALHVASCSLCSQHSFWLADRQKDGGPPQTGRMLSPAATLAPMPHPEMPKDVRLNYDEARRIV